MAATGELERCVVAHGFVDCARDESRFFPQRDPLIGVTEQREGAVG